MISIDLDSASPWEADVEWQTVAERAIAEAFCVSSYGNLSSAPITISISISLSSNSEVQRLNRIWRDKDKPTNVLSFPMLEPDEVTVLANTDDSEILLGDIILAHGVCAAEAEERGITLANHATHLFVHGMLHLLGYDHIDDAEADAMEALEIKALASLGLPNPYSDLP